MNLFIILAIIGYICGNFVTSYFVAKGIYKVDLRKYGSGNLGSTNALRTTGKMGGLLTFIGDLCKSMIPVLIFTYMNSKFNYIDNNVDIRLYQLSIGFFATLGHIFPFWLGFKGGKGIATIAGGILAIDYRVLIVLLSIFIIIVFITKYVSLASVILACIYPFAMYFTVFGEKDAYKVVLFSALFSIIVIYKHKDNIKRLLNGTEHKITKKVDVK